MASTDDERREATDAGPVTGEASILSRDDLPEQFRTETLRMYYKWLFPHKEMYRWLSYGNDLKIPGSDQGESFFRRREFSFTLENDIYVRYQSFRDAADMEEQIVKKCPHKIDIGAVYSVDPKMKSALQGGQHFTPVERELVFDVDMTDYDDVRNCCTGASVCDKCWTLMTVAIKVVDRVLREDFGFELILWVFSGRRGVHCWVCDARARRLSDEQRCAITDYFRVTQGTEANEKQVSFRSSDLHPALFRAYDTVLVRYFKKILVDQQLLDGEAACSKLLACIDDKGADVRQRLAEKWMQKPLSGPESNLTRWDELTATVDDIVGQRSTPWGRSDALKRSIYNIVFGYTYPRLDLNVSKHMNHLLKAPFCIHPKTGRVCVPIDPGKCDKFRPDEAPTLVQLMEEMNQSGKGGEQPSAEGTSLEEHIKFFRQGFLGRLSETCKGDLLVKHREKLEDQRHEGSLAF